MQSADFMVSYTSTLGRLIDAGVNVALIHGDRDYRCNCKFCSLSLLPCPSSMYQN